MPSSDRSLDAQALALVLTWSSPALPIGAFSYSHGLEQLFEDGRIPDAQATLTVIERAIVAGSGRTDTVLLGAAYRAVAADDEAALEEARAFGLALAPSAERHGETVRQGNAFAQLVDAVWPAVRPLTARGDWPLPVVFGAAGALHGLPVGPLAQAALSAFAANLVSAAVRLVPLGQTDGQRLVARLAPTVARVADEACREPLEAAGGGTLGLDLASLRHECQEVRLFRS